MKTHLEAWQISADDFPADNPTSDQIEFLLGYAILAPSSHNTQPWFFRLNAMDVEILADRRRALPVVDPFDRELTMSCAAALYNLRVAAEYFGHRYQVSLLPDPADANLLARFELGLRCETSSEDVLLFHAIPKRHTNRQPFSPEPVPEVVLNALEAAACKEGAWLQVVRGEDARNAVADLIAEADRVQWANKRFREELAGWVRTKADDARDGLSGHALGVKDWLSLAGPALIRTFVRGGGQAAKDRDIAIHSPVLVVLGTDEDNALNWIAAGQALQSVLLRARTEDVWASFLSQPVQVEDLRPRIGEVTGCGGCPQALLRLGYGPEEVPTPRRGIRELLARHRSTHSE